MSEKIADCLASIIQYGYSKQAVDSVLKLIDGNNISVSRKVYLGLKHGDVGAAQKILKSMQHCACQNVNDEMQFDNIDAYKACTTNVDSSLANGLLKRIDKPAWVQSDPQSINPTAYYQCQKCSLVWELSAPERGNKGSWKLADH